MGRKKPLQILDPLLPRGSVPSLVPDAPEANVQHINMGNRPDVQIATNSFSTLVTDRRSVLNAR